MSESRTSYRTSSDTLLQSCENGDNMESEQSRRMLARGLDELQREAMQTERALLQWLNMVRAIQGKRPVIVPKG
jgi:hypothetical protein